METVKMMELMRQRHSVRRFTDEPLNEEAVKVLQQEIDNCNRESGMNIQLITNEPEAFQANKPSYGQFKGCKNYLVIVGPKGKDIEAGYYGERIVLKAQELGINSCWVALTYKKGKAQGTEKHGEKRYLVVALGYGESNGDGHKLKSITDVSDFKDGDPEWYKSGIEAALLAPTAVNQQKFRFDRNGEKVALRVSGLGFYTKIDLGIVKYHFEIGSGKGQDVWKK
ncbi:nitroreductase family protein [Peptostreptococcus porci]|uniref:nitroreductase family protein n=1 Tax=Peptostreptococcus porci TaxID=2652282 RepID=UPI0023F06360|nr:nitroreductase family protein [Peptostreptococcus porci]MDD7183583.1 nitroreductase family protein [Peptostreptococcus porci]MDY5963467.1 nitroreductase family protein [Peptostreptococcus porci]